MKVPESVIRSAKFQALPAADQLAIMRLWTIEDEQQDRALRVGLDLLKQAHEALDAVPVDEPWCPDHGYGCEPSPCPCGHTLRCDCRSIADEH